MIRVHNTGAVTVYTGTSPHGQGLETAMAQIVADKLGVDPSVVEVIHGDTSMGPEGRNTYGSRSLATGGEAVARATDKVVAKAKAIVAAELEAAAEDIEVAGGKFSVKGSPDKGMALADVAGIAYIGAVPEGMEPGLEETTFYDPENFVFPFGAHACIVDVDAETGKVKVIRYVAVDDCGNAVNPMLIDGQMHGGVVHGIGQALYERVHYDDEGQLVTGTFVDYALATAAELPSFETDRTVTPSPVNSLGVKGVGEAGTIAASAAVTNAVIDALRPLGVDYINMPLSPMRVWEAISRGKGRCRMIPAEFDYVAAESLEDAINALVRRRRGRQAAGRRPLAAPTDEAAAGGAVAARRPAQGPRTARGGAPERPLADRGDDAARGARAHARAGARLAGRGDDRRPAGPQPRHDRRQLWPTATPRRTCRRRCCCARAR